MRLPKRPASRPLTPNRKLIEKLVNTVIDAVEPDRAGAREGLEAFALAMFVYARGHPTLQFNAADVARVMLGLLYDWERHLPSSDAVKLATICEFANRPDDEGA